METCLCGEDPRVSAITELRHCEKAITLSLAEFDTT